MGKKRNKLIVALVTLIVFMGVYILFVDSDKIVKTSDKVHEKIDHGTLNSVHGKLQTIVEGDLLKSLPNEAKDSIVRSIKMDFEILREKDFYSLEMNQCIKVLERNNDELTENTANQLFEIVHAVHKQETEHINDMKQENK